MYYAATHQEAQMCATDPVGIVGGGNSAGQATVFLAEQVSHVHLLIRGGRSREEHVPISGRPDRTAPARHRAPKHRGAGGPRHQIPGRARRRRQSHSAQDTIQRAHCSSSSGGRRRRPRGWLMRSHSTTTASSSRARTRSTSTETVTGLPAPSHPGRSRPAAPDCSRRATSAAAR